MNKKVIIGLIVSILVLGTVIWFFIPNNKKETQDEIDTSELTATVLAINDEYLTVQDKNDIIYTFENFQSEDAINIGELISLSYTGSLDKNTELQDVAIIECAKLEETDIQNLMEEKSPFSMFYKQAYNILEDLSLEEKVGQLLLVGAPETGQAELLKKYPYSGYILYKRDFENKTENQIINNIKSLQKVSKIPLLIAVDEEGGKVVRVGSNSKIVPNSFKSPKELYDAGGMSAIKTDTVDKSRILNNLGINVNLAPVVDVTTDPGAYMYNRTIGQNTEITSEFARTVISTSKGTGVSYTLKHFPGYGNNTDTHKNESTDNTSYEDIVKNNLPPFKAGTEAGAEAVLVNHNIIKNVDDKNPASLSASVHNLLRNTVGFNGIAMTDDLSMAAITADDALVKALLAGNDLLIVTDPTDSISNIVSAVKSGTLDEKVVDKAALRVIAWKLYKNLFDNK